jgi:hypothetical protein
VRSVFIWVQHETFKQKCRAARFGVRGVRSGHPLKHRLRFREKKLHHFRSNQPNPNERKTQMLSGSLRDAPSPINTAKDPETNKIRTLPHSILSPFVPFPIRCSHSFLSQFVVQFAVLIRSFPNSLFNSLLSPHEPAPNDGTAKPGCATNLHHPRFAAVVKP